MRWKLAFLAFLMGAAVMSAPAPFPRSDRQEEQAIALLKKRGASVWIDPNDHRRHARLVTLPLDASDADLLLLRRLPRLKSLHWVPGPKSRITVDGFSRLGELRSLKKISIIGRHPAREPFSQQIKALCQKGIMVILDY